MEDWQREAFLAVAEAVAGGDPEAVGRSLGGLPAVRVEGGCPVVVDPGRGGVGPDRGPRCGAAITRGSWRGRTCVQAAGQGTVHLGAGRCVAHGGAKRRGRAEAAWMVAHSFARELDVSPWEALLRAVRIAAGKVAYCEWVLSQASSDLELEGRFGRTEDGLLLHPDTGEPLGAGQVRDLSWWVGKSELWTDRMARYSKMAIDAGVAERLVQQVELDGQAMGRVLTAALGELEGQVSEDVVARVRSVMRSELLAIETEQGGLRASRDADARVVDSTYVKE